MTTTLRRFVSAFYKLLLELGYVIVRVLIEPFLRILGRLIIIVFVGVMILGAGFVAWNSYWGEQIGTIKTDDCRIQVAVNPRTALYNTFTCAISNDEQGIPTYRFCSRVETENGVCIAAYNYIRRTR